jgi:signal transduction histidine kinase
MTRTQPSPPSANDGTSSPRASEGARRSDLDRPPGWSLTKRLGLLFVVGAAAFVAVATTTLRGLELLRIDGPMHRSLALSHELTEDIKPPPFCLLETWIALQEGVHANGVDEVRGLERRLADQRILYSDAVAHWSVPLSDQPEIRHALLVDSLRPAREIFGLIDREYLPALRSFDHDRVHELLHGSLAKEIVLHRAAVDRVLELNRARNAELRSQVHKATERIRTELALVMAASFIGVGWLSLTFSRRLIHRLKNLRSAMRAYAAGDYSARSPVDENDELTQVCRSYNSLADETTRRNRDLAATIAELERLQEEKHELHRQMLVSARQAGMADIATGVLHNVGNILNSVNVSAGLMLDRTRASKVTRVGDAARMLVEHRDDAGEFFTRDERGRRLPDYLAKLAETLCAERDAMVAEIRELNDSVAHIKKIIQRQQALSKLGGLNEPTVLAEVVLDAEKFMRSTAEKRGVNIATLLPELEPILIDRQKVLQIVVNLVKNGIEALEVVSDRPRALSISVRSAGEKRQEIVVKDSGCGIAQDKLALIFLHGFTTKKTGHGFGLHSCVNLAREMGGDLTVSSEGEGHGAVFLLTLPANADGDTSSTIPEESPERLTVDGHSTTSVAASA